MDEIIMIKSNQIEFLKKEIKYKMIILICISLILISLVIYYFDYLLDPIFSIIPICLIFLISFSSIMTIMYSIKYFTLMNSNLMGKGVIDNFLLAINVYKIFYDKTDIDIDLKVCSDDSEKFEKIFIYDLHKVKNISEIIDRNEVEKIKNKLNSDVLNSYPLNEDL